jgi:hypothetical protein
LAPDPRSSEEGGFFRFQFMSNEREFPFVIPELKKASRPAVSISE